MEYRSFEQTIEKIKDMESSIKCRVAIQNWLHHPVAGFYNHHFHMELKHGMGMRKNIWNVVYCMIEKKSETEMGTCYITTFT